MGSFSDSKKDLFIWLWEDERGSSIFLTLQLETGVTTSLPTCCLCVVSVFLCFLIFLWCGKDGSVGLNRKVWKLSITPNNVRVNSWLRTKIQKHRKKLETAAVSQFHTHPLNTVCDKIRYGKIFMDLCFTLTFILQYQPDSEYPTHYISHNSTSPLELIFAHSFFIDSFNLFFSGLANLPQNQRWHYATIFTHLV